jgi:hypothetical protein
MAVPGGISGARNISESGAAFSGSEVGTKRYWHFQRDPIWKVPMPLTSGKGA